MDQYAPLITKTVRDNNSSPWYTDDLHNLKREKRRCEEKYKRLKNLPNLISFKILRLKYIHECNEAKKRYYSDLIVDCGNDQRRLFRVISKLTKGDSKSIYPDEISSDLCNNFNNFFVNKVNNIRDEIDSINNIENISGLDIYRDMNPSCPGFTEFKCVSKEHILKLISSSKPTTCALDPLPTPLFKTLASILIDPLYELINKSLTEGVFPSYWKTSIVTPIIKKPSLPACYPNYRPVSNLSFASKILEKVVIEQFTDHLILYKLAIDILLNKYG